MIRIIALFVAIGLLAAPASACDLLRLPSEAYVSNILVGLDDFTTVTCLKKHTCVEANPLYGGKTPSHNTFYAVGAARVVGTTAFTCFLQDRDPKAARIFSIVNMVITGGVVMANLRFVF